MPARHILDTYFFIRFLGESIYRFYKSFGIFLLIEFVYSKPTGVKHVCRRIVFIESLDEFNKSMDGIYSTSICESTIDECPMAYKPIDEIMECVQDTVYVMKVIKPIYNFKAIE